MRVCITCLICSLAVNILSATPIPVVTAELVNAGSPKIVQNGVYIGPYTLNINGVNYAAMCIDFEDDSTIGTSYSAYETQVSSNNFSETYHPLWGTKYKEEAYLLSLILQPNADRIDIQDAAWAITDSHFIASTAAKVYIDMAEKNYFTMTNLSDFEIISGTNQGYGRAQEFMIDPRANAPEPASVFLIGGGLLMAGLARRKRAKVA